MTRKRKAERTSQAPVPVLDHGVITVANRLDEASARYRRLGFQLSERSHPTPGSSHHLAIFAENYLALLGYALGRGEQHKDLWQAPLGLSGLVWKTQDAESAFQHLQRQDLDGEAPATFYRPVTLPDGAASEAHFRTVRLRPALIPNGQSFFCQHDTPQAVWQAAWQPHPNGVHTISEFVIVAQDPALAAQVYSHLFGADRILACQDGAFVLKAGAAQVRFASASYAQTRFGSLPEDYDGSARMSALSFRSNDLAKVKTSLLLGDIPFREEQEAIVVAAEQGFNVALRFHV